MSSGASFLIGKLLGFASFISVSFLDKAVKYLPSVTGPESHAQIDQRS
jgi:hypothetical protein